MSAEKPSACFPPPTVQTYECLCALIEGTIVRHLSQTRLMHDTSAYTLMQLTKKLAKKTYGRLLRKVHREEELEKIFHTWELWIFRGLPFYHLVINTVVCCAMCCRLG